jgi:hypothetical protein
MRSILCLIAFVPLMACAGACELTSVLVQRFGISALGFSQELPPAEAPLRDRQDSYQRLMLNERGVMLDGFQHMAYIDTASHQAWIVRTGGFSGVAEWYGPVAVRPDQVSACVRELPAP